MNNKCPKCGGEMEEGTLVDSMGGLSQSQKWATKIKAALIPENSKQVQSYRCQSCGFLESYAK